MIFKTEISFGDLFTGISVIIAAIGVAATIWWDRRQRRVEIRTDALRQTIQSFLRVLEDGYELLERIE